MSKTNYEENKMVDVLFRGQSVTIGANTLSWSPGAPTWYFALLVADFIRSEINSQAVALNDTVWVVTTKGVRLYKVTTAGNLAASQPAYAGANSEVIADGTASLTEQYTAIEDGTALVEPASPDYARKALASSLTNFSSTQGDALASTGTDGTIENSVAVDYPDATTAGYGKLGGFAIMDAASGGTAWRVGYMGSPVSVGLGATGIAFASGQLSVQEDG